ncbi:Na+/H+ antiporter NhaA [Tsuneonella sp. HG222]
MPTKLIAELATRPLRALFVSDAREGILLILVALLAMVAANTFMADTYREVFLAPLPWTPIPKLRDLHLWINDGLMAVFFFVVGLEVKRELMEGELSDPKNLRLPVLAAFLGMAVPAGVFLLITGSDSLLARGWAVPSATDIAFAMGIVGLLGKRMPPPLRLFLLTVAIVDDIGAVLIIAFFYTANIKLAWLFGALAVAMVLVLMNWLKVDRNRLFVAAALVLWFCVLHSGVHATIAGVVAALTVPMRRRDGRPMLADLEHRLVGWNAYFVIPVFGFANAGVDLRGLGLEALFAPLPMAVAAGLVLGKQIGVFGAVLIAEWIGLARRMPGVTLPQLYGAAVLCGIGFTMSLFIGTLAFEDHPELYEQVKLGVLAGTLVSAVLGYMILRIARPEPEPS